MAPSARDDAVRLLAGRGLTEAELRARLLARGHAETEVAAALGEARAARWLDDAALAREALRAGSAKGRGRQRLLDQLVARGIPRKAAEAAWEALLALGDLDPGAALRAEVERRVHAEGGAPTGKAAARIYNALLRRGHDPDSIRSALAPFVGDDDDLP